MCICEQNMEEVTYCKRCQALYITGKRSFENRYDSLIWLVKNLPLEFAKSALKDAKKYHDKTYNK